jgi:hypothetical protein
MISESLLLDFSPLLLLKSVRLLDFFLDLDMWTELSGHVVV